MTQFEILMVLAASISAVGTIMASIVALYLARRSSKVTMRTYFGIRSSVSPTGPIGKAITFGVTNLGDRPIKISLLGWQIGRKGVGNQSLCRN